MYSNYRIAVIGDFMADEWWRAESMKICPEAPVPDLINPVLVRRSAGGAGNVARNLLSLGAKVSLYGIIGRDDAGYAIISELVEAGADWKVEPVNGFDTHRKVRYCGDGRASSDGCGQMVFRVSLDRCRATGIEDDIIRQFDIVKNSCWDAVIVSDYNKGMMLPYIIDRVMKSEIPVFVDPKFDNIALYVDAELIKFNKAEAMQYFATVRASSDARPAEYSIAKLQQGLRANNVVVTLGHGGMEVIDIDGDIWDIPGKEVQVSDVTGAGDTATAVLTLEYLRTGSIVKAAHLANHACSLVVQKRMTAVVTIEELEAVLEDSDE